MLFSIGTRFNDRITGKISEFAKNAKIIHVDIDSAAISRNIKVDIPIVGDAAKAIGRMLDEAGNYGREDWTAQINAWKEEHPISHGDQEGLTPENIIGTINEMFTEAIVVTDVGQHQMWTCLLYTSRCV